MTVIFTHRETEDGGELRNQLCQCSECGDIDVCTPQTDFFVLGPRPSKGKPLLCQPCFLARVASKGIATLVIAEAMPGELPDEAS